MCENKSKPSAGVWPTVKLLSMEETLHACYLSSSDPSIDMIKVRIQFGQGSALEVPGTCLRSMVWVPSTRHSRLDCLGKLHIQLPVWEYSSETGLSSAALQKMELSIISQPEEA